MMKMVQAMDWFLVKDGDDVWNKSVREREISMSMCVGDSDCVKEMGRERSVSVWVRGGEKEL
jgi:hypothetical protein